MKNFLILIIFFSLQSNASEFGILVLDDNSIEFGEIIERYQDRWFWEDEDNAQNYILIFRNINNKAKFKLINTQRIKKLITYTKMKSIYKDFLKTNNLFFKNKLVEDSIILTGNDGHHKFEKMYGNFAWDIGMMNNSNLQYDRDGSCLNDFLIFDRPVISPLSGFIVGKENENIDNLPDLSFQSSLVGLKNNYLTIKVHESIYMSLVHFKENSISLEVGQKVLAGQYLGRVGNSGISYLPHLHFTLYTYIEEIKRFISVPGFFESLKN